MSDFGKALFELLPVHSALQDKNNPGRKVIDNTIGEWFDRHDINRFYDNLFLDTATGGYLDLFGRDYGIGRRLDEGDDDYRVRIIQEKNDNLTPTYLEELYGVKLFSAFDGFCASDNDLTSDNPYLTDWYMGIADSTVQDILNNKFIIGGSIVWYDGTTLDYIIGYPSSKKMLKYNLDIYNSPNLKDYPFKYSDGMQYPLVSVKLHLPIAKDIRLFFEDQTRLTEAILDCPNATHCSGLFKGCTSLTTVDLNLPNATTCGGLFNGCTALTNIDLTLLKNEIAINMFRGCTSLKNVKLNLPKLLYFEDIFKNDTALETIDVIIPTEIVNDFKTYVLGLNLSHLTSFKINGEEVDLS